MFCYSCLTGSIQPNVKGWWTCTSERTCQEKPGLEMSSAMIGPFIIAAQPITSHSSTLCKTTVITISCASFVILINNQYRTHQISLLRYFLCQKQHTCFTVVHLIQSLSKSTVESLQWQSRLLCAHNTWWTAGKPILLGKKLCEHDTCGLQENPILLGKNFCVHYTCGLQENPSC